MRMKEENSWDPLGASKEQAQRLLETTDKDQEQGHLFTNNNRDGFSLEGAAKIQRSRVQSNPIKSPMTYYKQTQQSKVNENKQ